MNTILLLAALGQFRYAGAVNSPPVVKASRAVAEPFPERPIPRVFRVVTQRETPSQRETFRVALADDPPKPAKPAPAQGIGDYSVPDLNRDNRIFQLEEQVKALTKRLAELEKARDGPVAPRAAMGDSPPAVVCPMGCPNCGMACRFPGECGHPGCGGGGMKTAVRATVTGNVSDEWRPMTANPAYEVCGHQDADGVFRYTQTRVRAGAVVATPPAVTYTTAPVSLATYAAPVTYGDPYYGVTYGSGFGAGSVCGPGGCGSAARGFFGRLLGR